MFDQNPHIHHHIHFDEDFLHLVNQIIKDNKIIMATLQNINDAVTQQATVEQSVVTLLNQIVQQLKDAVAAQDPAALDAVVANITANTKVLSDAVAANTPAAPPVPAPTAVKTVA